MPNTRILIFLIFLAVQRGKLVNPCSTPYIRFPLRFKLRTLAKNRSVNIVPDGHDNTSFQERFDRPQDTVKRSDNAIKAQSVSILDWVLHIYYTHFRRESPISFSDRNAQVTFHNL